VTFSCSSARLHSDASGSVDWHNNLFGSRRAQAYWNSTSGADQAQRSRRGLPRQAEHPHHADGQTSMILVAVIATGLLTVAKSRVGVC